MGVDRRDRPDTPWVTIGSSALRALASMARRSPAGIDLSPGAPNTRVATRPHCGHAVSGQLSVIGRVTLNAPQETHRYS